MSSEIAQPASSQSQRPCFAPLAAESCEPIKGKACHRFIYIALTRQRYKARFAGIPLSASVSAARVDYPVLEWRTQSAPMFVFNDTMSECFGPTILEIKTVWTAMCLGESAYSLKRRKARNKMKFIFLRNVNFYHPSSFWWQQFRFGAFSFNASFIYKFYPCSYMQEFDFVCARESYVCMAFFFLRMF